MYKHTLSFLLIVLLLLAVLSMQCGCTNVNSASFVTQTFVSAMEQKDFSTAYSCLWQRAEIIPEETFLIACQNIMDTLDVTAVTFTDTSIETEDSTLYFNYTICYESADGYTLENSIRLHMLQEDGTYYIEYLGDMLLPEYTPDCKITRITLKGSRGEIFTADGMLVATNDYSETIYLKVNNNLDATSTLYAIDALVDIPEDEWETILSQYDFALKNVYASVIATVLPKGTLTSELRASLLAIEGVGIDTDSLTPQRYYPYANIYAHAVGYASSPTEEELSALAAKGYSNATLVGKTGVEEEYDLYLQPKNGFKINLYTSDGSYISTLYEQAAEDGADIYLTINSSAQQETYYLLESYFLGDQTGASIVMDPTTGFVEALVSSPSYDPNIFSFPVEEDYLAELNSEENLTPFFNRVTFGLYPPGSIIKPFSVTPALENNIITRYTVFPYTVTNNQWTPNGVWYWDPVTRNETPDAALDLDTAIRFSDNIYFSWAALKTGDTLFMEYMERIGIGEAVLFDLPTADSNLINEGTEMTRKLLSDMAFGHGEILITPLQTASLYTVFQNGGDILVPKLVWKICRNEGDSYETIYQAEREVYIENVMREDTVDILTYSLKRVVLSGTAKSLKITGKTIAAKTGTALKGEEKDRKIAWIAGWYQDMSEDRLVVVVVDSERYASDNRHAIARSLLDWTY